MRTGLLIGAVLVVAAAGLRLTVFSSGGAAYTLETTTVDAGPVVMTVETNGTVEPLRTVLVGCETTGKIIETIVDHDDPVHKDQIICRIDPELANAQHEQSVAELNRAKAALADAKLARDEQIANLPVATAQALARVQETEAALVEADYNWQRVDKLYHDGNAGEAEWTSVKATHKRAAAAVTAATAAYDRAKNDERFLAQRAEQAVAQADAAARLAQARFDGTKTKVDKCVIHSPIDGIVLKRYMDVGVTVNATLQTPTLFLLAPSLERVRVNAKVSESDIVHVEKGQTARFTIDARGRRTFEGRIIEKRSQPDIIQNVVTYTVIFEVDNDARGTLLPGLTVNVEIECVKRPHVTRIANAALRFQPPLSLKQRRARINAATWPPRPVGDTDGARLDYCTKAHTWRFDPATEAWSAVPLWVGITDNTDTEVLAGAKPGDHVVRKFHVNQTSGFSLQDALKEADPQNRRVL